jgi:hypothetical protein
MMKKPRLPNGGQQAPAAPAGGPLLTPRAARILLPFGAIAMGGVWPFTRALATAGGGKGAGIGAGWGVGLDFTPPYVPSWRRPTSVAAGKRDGLIPRDALAFETGNAGQPFASLDDWIAACNAQDLPGAIETPIAVRQLGRTYLARGIYGAGPADVKIRWLGREEGSSHCWLHVQSSDVVVRGIDFDGFNIAVGVTFPTLPLTSRDGSLDGAPYHTSTEVVYRALKSSVGGPADGLWCKRLGRLRLDGPFTVRALGVRRQRAGTAKAGGENRDYFDRADWESVLDTVPLVEDAACESVEELVDAINARAEATGYAARLNGPGEIFLLANSAKTRAIAEIAITGEGAIRADVQAPAIDVSHCTFTDTNLALGAVLDVSELGPVRFCKNDLPGTWSGVGAIVTRWSEIYFANNHWRECSPERPSTQGRISSCLPAGSSQTAFNTACYVGTNSPVMMRYHAAGNIALIENNRVSNIQSLNRSDTVNSAVVADIRNGWQVTGAGRIIRIAYNDVESCRGAPGARDCNLFYGKLRGFSVIGNRFRGFGSTPRTIHGERVASEGLALLFKNPGPYNGPIEDAYSEPVAIWGNQFVDGTAGVPWIKLDEMICPVVIEHNLFQGWSRGDAPAAGQVAGLIRLTSHQQQVHIQSNRIEAASREDAAAWPLISLWNIKEPAAGMDLANSVIANNEVVLGDASAQAEGPVPIAIISLSSPTPALTASLEHLAMGNNALLSRDGEVLVAQMPLRHGRRAALIQGRRDAGSGGYEEGRALKRYGAS